MNGIFYMTSVPCVRKIDKMEMENKVKQKDICKKDVTESVMFALKFQGQVKVFRWYIKRCYIELIWKLMCYINYYIGVY